MRLTAEQWEEAQKLEPLQVWGGSRIGTWILTNDGDLQGYQAPSFKFSSLSIPGLFDQVASFPGRESTPRYQTQEELMDFARMWQLACEWYGVTFNEANVLEEK